MDDAKLAELLNEFTPDQLDVIAEEFHAYARHLRIAAAAPVGAAMAPFSLKNFFKNAIKFIQVVYPAVAPLVGLDTKPDDPSRHE